MIVQVKLQFPVWSVICDLCDVPIACRNVNFVRRNNKKKVKILSRPKKLGLFSADRPTDRFVWTKFAWDFVSFNCIFDPVYGRVSNRGIRKSFRRVSKGCSGGMPTAKWSETRRILSIPSSRSRGKWRCLLLTSLLECHWLPCGHSCRTGRTRKEPRAELSLNTLNARWLSSEIAPDRFRFEALALIEPSSRRSRLKFNWSR